MWAKIRVWLSNWVVFFIAGLTAGYTAAGLYGWHSNAVHGTHYDLEALKGMYVQILLQLNGFHLINSGLNTPIPGVQKGDKPQ